MKESLGSHEESSTAKTEKKKENLLICHGIRVFKQSSQLDFNLMDLLSLK